MILKRKNNPGVQAKAPGPLEPDGEANIKKLFAMIKLALKFNPNRQFSYPEKEYLTTLRRK